MPAVRGIPVVLALAAVLLSGCAAAAGSGSHSSAWETGYRAGVSARHHYWHRRHRPEEDMTLYCVNKAYTGIKDVAISAAVQWTEGFDVGCAHSSL